MYFKYFQTLAEHTRAELTAEGVGCRAEVGTVPAAGQHCVHAGFRDAKPLGDGRSHVLPGGRREQAAPTEVALALLPKVFGELPEDPPPDGARRKKYPPHGFATIAVRSDGAGELRGLHDEHVFPKTLELLSALKPASAASTWLSSSSIPSMALACMSKPPSCT